MATMTYTSVSLLNAIVVLQLCWSPAPAQHDHNAASEKPAMLLPGMGDHHHPISTRNPEAQKFFDQGLTLVYAFNRPEALRSFRRAAELDPKAAMPHWGIALASGPHINMDLDGDVDGGAGYDRIHKALSLSSAATEHERAFIEALARRFSKEKDADQKKLGADYTDAMAEVTRRYPDDLDAATLYAEALMMPSRWRWFGSDGKP